MNSREKAQTKEFKEFKELQEFKNAIRTRPWRKEHGYLYLSAKLVSERGSKILTP